ncbi:unnamed protein product [Prorocentrum cordatum]|uniref:Uncharacterized protein n=1 Tax=Prorocentrum cordatum TaxID=2364126 RepID=A0ABN9VH44_9DINO|nr:unnamed protein product [Polarella glacialis]
MFMNLFMRLFERTLFMHLVVNMVLHSFVIKQFVNLFERILEPVARDWLDDALWLRIGDGLSRLIPVVTTAPPTGCGDCDGRLEVLAFRCELECWICDRGAGRAAPGVSRVATGPPGQVRTRTSVDVDGPASPKQGQRAEAQGEDAACGSPAGAATGEALMLSPGFDEDAPEELRPSETVPNLFFSRKKVMDFIEGLLERKQKYSPHSLEPFAKFMSTHLPDGEPNEHGVFTANISGCLRPFRHRAGAAFPPDFLAYSLLLKNKISYSVIGEANGHACRPLAELPGSSQAGVPFLLLPVIRDNKGMCKELLHIFTTEFETEDASEMIPKQRFFYDLQEVLPNKTKEMWQDLSTVFPAGGQETIVNYRWLLQDDIYVHSPIVYTLRLQHLEECISLSEKLERLTLEVAKGSPKTVTFAAIEDVFSNEPDLEAIQAHVLEGDTEHEWGKFIEAMRVARRLCAEAPGGIAHPWDRAQALKQGEIFHKLYFPELLPEEDEET